MNCEVVFLSLVVIDFWRQAERAALPYKYHMILISGSHPL